VKSLVIQTAFLGDLVLTLPLLRRLHDDAPDTRITLAVRPSLAAFAREQYGVDEVLPLSKRRGWLQRLGHDRGVLQALSEPGFDTVYLAHRSFRSGLYARLTGAPTRVGFDDSPASWACTDRVDCIDTSPAAERYLMLAGPLSRFSGDPGPRVSVSEEARRTRDALFTDVGIDPERPFVTIMPGSMWATKRWTEAGFAGVARWFHERRTPVVLDGSPDEHELCERIREAAGGTPVNIAGRTPLPVLAAALQVSRLLLGNDSGPAHLAAAVGTPVVVVYGPTVPEAGLLPTGRGQVWPIGRKGLECRPCGRHGAQRCPLEHHRCMQSLEVTAVIDAIERGMPGVPPG